MASILLIDDDDVLREVIASALERQGYQVRQAVNGKEGMALFHDKRPDIVITDLIMPEKEGLETIALLKEIDPSVRIIAISGNAVLPSGRVFSTLSSLDCAAEMGARYILQKPFDLKVLFSTVETLVRELSTPTETV